MVRLNKKRFKTLKAVFVKPPPPNIDWKDIEKLFKALGASLEEGRGSRVRVILKDVYAVFHRPHPERITDKGAVESVKRFLQQAGITPDGD